MVHFFDMWMKLTANNTASPGAVACIEANGFWICSWKNVTSSIILGSWGQSSLEAPYPPPERCLQSAFFFKLSGNKPPFFGIFCRSTRKKTVTHVWSVGWCTDEIVGKVSSSFLFLANLYWDPNCQKEDLWRNWADFFKVCSSLRFMHVPCPSPFPRTTFSLHCLLVAVLRDQILIEVSGRVKSPHLNF